MRFSPTFYKMILPRLLFTQEILWQYEFILSLYGARRIKNSDIHCFTR